MEKLGKELHFISQVCPDGNGTAPVGASRMAFLQVEKFTLKGLSLSEGTYIASGFNSYVVRLKPSRMKFKKDEDYSLHEISDKRPNYMEAEEYGWDLPGRQFLLLTSHKEVYSFVSIKPEAGKCYRCVHAEILNS